jgi:hypothetical protein
MTDPTSTGCTGSAPYAQTDEDHRLGHVDLEKWLTYYIGPRRPFTRVWALAPLRAE